MESELVRTIAASVHGRYLVRVPEEPGPWPVLVGFHGYGEDAATNLAALQRIPNAAGWLIVAVQALHPFYTKSERIVASWMTRQDRELAIADNTRYAASVIDSVRAEFSAHGPIAVAGFSQGGAMAYRTAARVAAAGVVILAADVPPDVTTRLPLVLIGRGRDDAWYTEEKMTGDLTRLKGLAAGVETCVFDGGHEWTDEFAAAAGAFLTRLRPSA